MVDSLVGGALGGVIAAVTLAAIAWAYRKFIQSGTACIELNHREIFDHPGIQLGLLHAWNDDGQPVNRVYRPKHRDGTVWAARVSHPKHLGFQYKWFVDYGEGWSGDQVKASLNDAGFENVGKGGGRPRRIWFEDESRPKVNDPRKPSITNNIFYPE